MKVYLSDIKKFIGRKSKLKREVLAYLKEIYNSPNTNKFEVAITRYVKEGLLFCSKPITFSYGEYALSCGRNHDYTKYYPIIQKHTDGLSIVLNILTKGCKYISLFNLRKLLVIDNSNENQFQKVKDMLYQLVDNLNFNNEYCYVNLPVKNDDQDLYEKNRDRILYTVIKKHEKENIIFGHSVYYKTAHCNNITAAYLSFDAYSKSTIFSDSDTTITYLVYDFAIDGNYSVKEARCFSNRFKKLARRLGCKIVPISIFATANKETLDYVKSNGIIIMDFKSILGRDYNILLGKISQFDKNIYSIDDFDFVLKTVSQYEQFDSIKGGLFEHLCAAILYSYKQDGTEIICNYPLKGETNNVNIAQFDIVLKNQIIP